MLKLTTYLLVCVVAIGALYKAKLSTDRTSQIAFATQNVPNIEPNTKAYFPQVSGRNVDNQSFRLPQDFAGKYNIVLLAFTQEQQFEVNTWLERLEEIESKNSKISVYELPTLPQLSWLEQKQVDFWMSAGILEPNARARTITLYTDVDSIQQSLQIEDISKIRLFLVDRTGNVYWRDRGAYTQQKLQNLSQTLSSLSG